MKFPIVDRELRVASRRPMTYWGRSGFALVAMVLTLWAVSSQALGVPGAAGRATFRTLALVALFSALGTAVRTTAPSIAGEKREGTLGLLFLTDLKPHDVVLGKFAASSLATFYGFLAIVPVLGIPILAGGVTAGDLAQLTLVLINAMFLGATVGLFASTLSVAEKGASSLATLLLLFILAAGPVAALLAYWMGSPSEVSEFLVTLSPGFVLASMMGGAGTDAFWRPWVVGHGCAWLLLAWTCRLLPRVWQDRPASVQQARRRERLRSIAQGDASSRARLRSELLAINPILWLTSRDRAVRWYPWIFLGSVGALMLWFTLKYHISWRERGLSFGATVFLQLFFKVWIGSQSACALSSDRDAGALELLLSTPLTTRDLVRGHWLALKRLFAAPILVLIAGSAVWTLWSIADDGTDHSEHHRAFWIYAYAVNLLHFVADIWALGWLGLWMGVKSRNSHQASARTQVRILLLPSLPTLCSMFLLSQFTSVQNDFSWWLTVWVFWSLIIDVIYARWSEEQLEHSLRAAALERQAAPPGGAPGWLRTVARGLRA